MSAPAASAGPVSAHSTASGAVAFNFEVTLNGAFGQPHVEAPIDFDAALAAYPSDAPLIDEPDWSVGGTPVGI